MRLAPLSRYRPAPDGFAPAGAIALAMVLGVNKDPVAQGIVQVVLAALVAFWVWSLPMERLRALPRGVWAVAGLIVALPALQLLPLPALVWHAMPGRQLEVASLTLIGQQDSWRPLSLSPYDTLDSLLSMVAAAAMLVMTSALTRAGRTQLLATVVVVALLSLLLGVGQMAGANEGIFAYFPAAHGWLSGFQEGHNAEADVLLIAIVACAAVARECITDPKRTLAKRVILGTAGALITLLTLGVVLTASRTGVALLAVALSAALVILRPLAQLSWRQVLIFVAVGAVLLIMVVVVLWHNAVIGRTVGRFETPDPTRPEIWQTAWLAARAYLPWGAGMGSFVPVFMGLERLDTVDIFYINRAHQDYLELLIEAGLMGVVWGLGILGILALAARHAFRQGQRISRGQLVCAISMLGVIALHSLNYFPLRSMSLSDLAAVAAGFLFVPESPGPRSEWKEQP